MISRTSSPNVVGPFLGELPHRLSAPSSNSSGSLSYQQQINLIVPLMQGVFKACVKTLFYLRKSESLEKDNQAFSDGSFFGVFISNKSKEANVASVAALRSLQGRMSLYNKKVSFCIEAVVRDLPNELTPDALMNSEKNKYSFLDAVGDVITDDNYESCSSARTLEHIKSNISAVKKIQEIIVRRHNQLNPGNPLLVRDECPCTIL